MFKKYRQKESGKIIEAFPEELVFKGGSKGYIYWHIKDSPNLIPDKQFSEQYEPIGGINRYDKQ